MSVFTDGCQGPQRWNKKKCIDRPPPTLSDPRAVWRDSFPVPPKPKLPVMKRRFSCTVNGSFPLVEKSVELILVARGLGALPGKLPEPGVEKLIISLRSITKELVYREIAFNRLDYP